MGEIYHE